MKHNIRILSFVLSVFMLFACLPGYAYAADTESPEAPAEETVEETAIPETEGIGEAHISTETMIPEEPDSVASTTVANGVYAFLSYSTLYQWISVENSSPWEGNHMRNKFSTDYPTIEFDRSCLFKITRVGTTGRYIIRSMINNNLSFGISGSEVITKTIASDDASVPLEDTFYIESDGSGYYIRDYKTSYVVNMPSTANGNLNTVLKGYATSSAKWLLTPYTGSHQSGITLYRPTSWSSAGNIVGNTSEATPIGWSTYINANTLSADIASECGKLGTLYWNSSTNVLTLTAQNPGQIRINCRIKYANGNVAHSGFFTHMIVPQAKKYYIENVGTGRYIESPSVTNGAAIQQWDFQGINQHKWIVEHVQNSGGYVRLKSNFSKLYIGVDSSNTSLVKQYRTENDYTLWKIQKKSNGYTFTCKATESTGLVLAIPLNANINGTSLTQVSYTDNTNYRDEWYLISETMNVEFSYDQGYITQNLASIGDLTSDLSQYISDYYFSHVEDAFSEIFNLNMELATSGISSYTSDADLCSNSNPIVNCGCIENTECILESHHSALDNNNSAGFEFNAHCKNISRLRNNLMNGISANTIRVTYTGHETCDTHGADLSNTVGLASFVYPIICIQETQIAPYSAPLLLAHELSHFYGATHHDPIAGSPCIMDGNEYVYNIVTTPSTYWCPNCIKIMKGNALK